MKARTTLSIRCRDREACKLLAEVMAPDNEGAPKGMSLKMRSNDGNLEFHFDSDSPQGALTTAIAILRDANLSQEVWLLSRQDDA